jgi:hypothetical protein
MGSFVRDQFQSVWKWIERVDDRLLRVLERHGHRLQKDTEKAALFRAGMNPTTPLPTIVGVLDGYFT